MRDHQITMWEAGSGLAPFGAPHRSTLFTQAERPIRSPTSRSSTWSNLRRQGCGEEGGQPCEFPCGQPIQGPHPPTILKIDTESGRPSNNCDESSQIMAAGQIFESRGILDTIATLRELPIPLPATNSRTRLSTTLWANWETTHRERRITLHPSQRTNDPHVNIDGCASFCLSRSTI